ncbi:MAG TPA: DUF4245 domain-containing protein [Marmoricola sp.]|nr:DUF4245 domain-containing protein [Marmoricola sp.]HNI69944.1 DUF4245 domain-containing protein [Marmoricola sp.]HNJ79149.1 DUF4245 domain-containing protein [Marmoricola sp.]HNO39308.1 DUF4245 domain-containing protein [Marmoricola sp.]
MPTRPSDPAASAPPPGEPRRGGHYERSALGLIGALLVTLLVVAGFMIFRGAFRDNKPVPTRAVDHQIWLERGQSDGQLVMAAPREVPSGWTVTSASYDGGLRPVWRMGMLTDEKKFVGLVESLDSLDPLLQKHMQENPQSTGTKQVAGRDWKSFTAAEGDAALALELTSPRGEPEILLVYGDAGIEQIREFAADLTIPKQ